jgi:SAM-dependent methyltransferase
VARGGLAELIDIGANEHYLDADLYDHEYKRRRADVAWYVELARRLVPAGGRILDLGCGTGRVTFALARAGFEVVGVDASPAMLARLEARRARVAPSLQARITTHHADLRALDLGPRAKFPLVISAFNVLEHLYTRVELAQCLAGVDRHLARGGRFAFDVQLPDLQWLMRDPDRRWAKTRFTHPRTGQKVFYSTNHIYDPISQIALIRIYYDPVDGSPGRVVLLSQRKYFPAELEALCAASGFATVERYGDFSGESLRMTADSQVLVLARQREFLDGNRASKRESSTGKPARKPVPRRGPKRSPSSPRRR